MTLRTVLVLTALLAGGVAMATDGASTDAPSDPVAAWQAEPDRVFSAADLDLDSFLWIARPIVVFADTAADPRFRKQMELLTERTGELVDRDVIVITDTDAGAVTDIRKKLRPRGFMLVLVGKDGGVKLRKPAPWSVRELSRSIDKMPVRQQELRDRRAADR